MVETTIKLTASTYACFRTVSVRPEEASLCFGGGELVGGMLFGHPIEIVDKAEDIPIAPTSNIRKTILQLSAETYRRFRSVPVNSREARLCFGSGLHPLEGNTLFRHPVEIVDEENLIMTTLIQPKGKTVIVIPARMDSKRLPGKPLLQVGNNPLLYWTYLRALQTKADYVIVATPDKDIGRYCQSYGLVWRPTRDDHPTGTHRCEEVIRQFRTSAHVDCVINWQCDEVLLDPKEVDRLIDSMGSTSAIMTLVAPMDSGHKEDRNVTKAAVGEGGRVYWFSREPMAGSMGHCGVYAFRPNTLRRLALLKSTALSQAESLEQLAWIEGGFIMEALEMKKLPLAVDTVSDLKTFRWLIEQNNL